MEQYKRGLVSAVTPVYNGEAHLHTLLDSLLAQTYPYMEIILADDGSTDGTVREAERCRDKFAAKGYSFRIVRGEHKNASAAINRGLPYVTGEFLIWPDSDDMLEPESVEKRVDFLKKHPQYQCVRSLSCYFDPQTGLRREERDERQGDLYKEDLFWDILESKTFVCCGCYMLRSGAFFSIYPERRIPEYNVGQNFQMLLPFMCRHKCPTIPEELYGVAVRPDSHSRTPLSQAQEERKYLEYEHLVDEIAAICQIEDSRSRERLECWKARRRYQISMKYGRKKEARQALRRLHRCGGLRNGEAVSMCMETYLIHSWIGRCLYPLYRKVRAFAVRSCGQRLARRKSARRR